MNAKVTVVYHFEDGSLSRSAIARYAREGSITPEVITPGGQYRFDLDWVRGELRQLAERRRNEQRDS